MNDKIIINTISNVHSNIVSFILFFILLLFTIFSFLINGIHLDNVLLPNIKIKQLYIKWDEKLTLFIDDATIIDSSNKNSHMKYEDIINIFNRASTFDNIFKNIEINNLSINDTKINFKYIDGNDGYLNIKAKNFSFSSILFFESHMFNVKIKKLIDHERNIKATGNIILDAYSQELISNLNIDIANDAKLNLISIINKKNIFYKINSLKNIENLKHIENMLNLNKTINYFAFDAIKMESLKILDAYGWIDYNDIKNSYKNIYVNADVEKLIYTYDTKLDPINTKHTELVFKDGTLYIKPKEAYTYDFFLDKSDLNIDFTKKQELLTLNLLFKGQLNKKLLYLLNRYKINLPILQKKGFIDTDLRLKINLRDLNVDAKGKFYSKNINLDLFGINLDAQNFNLTLDNYDINIHKIDVQYKKIANANVSMKYNAKHNKGDINLKFSSINFKDSNLSLNKPLRVNYHISNHKDKIFIPSSKWKFFNKTTSVDRTVVYVDTKKAVANITPTFLKIKDLGSAYASGNIYLKNMLYDFNIDILKLKYQDLKLNQSITPVKLKYNDKLTLELKNKLYFSISNNEFLLQDTKIEIFDHNLLVNKTNLSMQNLFSSTFNAKYNFTDNKGYLNINKLNISTTKSGELFSNKEDIVLDLKSYNDTLSIKSKQLDMKLISTDEKYLINFNSLAYIKENSTFLNDYNITKSNLKIYKYKDRNITNFIFNTKFPYKFLVNNNKPDNNYKIKGSISDNSNIINLTLNDKIKVAIGDDININANSCGLNINDIFKFVSKNKSKEDNNSSKKLFFNFTNSYLYIGENRKILSDSMNLEYINNTLTAQLKHKKGDAGLKLENNNLNFYGKGFSDEFMSNLFSLSKFKNGVFSFSIAGTTQDYKGIFYIKNTTILKYKILNNILAFVNTIPSLVTFSLPDYNSKGLYVDNGYIEFESKDDIFDIKNIFIDSKELDILGKGEASIKNNNIDLELNLKTDLGSSIAKIPIVGYILLGKDSISTTLSVKGKLDQPKIKSLIAKNIIVAPLNIIKRTILLPYHLFGSDEENNDTAN